MSEADATRDVCAVRTVIDAWYGAMQEGRVTGLLSLVTHDVIVKPPGSPPIEGKNVLKEALSAFLEKNSETVEHEIEEVEVSGQVAFARVSESTTIWPRSGGNASSVNGMHLTILRRQPDGDWLIARDISSLIDGG